MRITDRGITINTLNNLQKSLGKSQQLQDQLSSGKLISKPSDSPTGAVQAMQLRSENKTVSQYSRNANDGMAWLGTLDSTLTGMNSQISRVRDLVLQGMNTGTATDGSQDALAAEVDTLRQSLIGMANTKYINRPIFGGTTAGTSAYDTSGAYVGDNGTVNRTVGDNAQVQVNLSGPEVFGADGSNLFDVLSSISDNLKNNPDALKDDLAKLDTVTGQMKTGLSQVGARYNRVENSKNSADSQALSLTSQQSEIEDVDLPQTIMEMQLQQTAYQSALSATAKVIQPSLVDFLR